MPTAKRGQLRSKPAKKKRVSRRIVAFGKETETMTWTDLSDCVRVLWTEMKRRNPIGINCYEGSLAAAYFAIKEIADAEKHNPTSEHGPGSK